MVEVVILQVFCHFCYLNYATYLQYYLHIFRAIFITAYCILRTVDLRTHELADSQTQAENNFMAGMICPLLTHFTINKPVEHAIAIFINSVGTNNTN